MPSKINKVLKTLTPLINQRLKELESGKAVPTIGTSFLDNPNFTGGIGLKSYAPPTDAIPTPANYRSLSPGTLNLLNSVRRLKQELPPEHHTSFFGHVLNTVEKPFHAITGGLDALEQYQKTPEGHSWSLKSLGKSFEKLGSGLEQGWEGKKKVNISDILAQDPIAKHQPNKLRAVEGFVGDVAIDPATYIGVGGLTKVRTLGRTAEEIAKAQEVERTLQAAGHREASRATEILLNPEVKEGRYYTKNQLGNAAQRADTMRAARNISQAYGNAAYNELYKENWLKATSELEKQGIKRYKTLDDFRKFMKGDASKTDLDHWNHTIRGDIKRRTEELTGDQSKFMEGKAQEILAIAAKNNFAGEATKTAENLQKALGIKFGKTTVAKLTIPRAVVKGTESVVASDKLKGVRDFAQSIHGHFNTVFRTGSHIEPMVNRLRMARHSSIVDLMNNATRRGNKIWQDVTREDRTRAAEAIAQGQHHVEIKGGHDALTGKDVTNVVQHGIDEVKHIEGLVGERKTGRLITFKEFNDALPANYRIPSKYKDDPNFLQHAWKDHYLSDVAKKEARHLYHFAKDPNVFLLAMQKAAFTAAADKELKHQIIMRFGHQAYEVDPLTGLKKKGSYKNPITRVLEENHGYRSPRIAPNSKKVIPGYEGAVFHEDVARGIEAMHRINEAAASMNKGATSETIQLFNKATSLFKTVVTKFNPGFHERNLIGEIFNSFADGVKTITPYKKALQVLRLHGKLALDTGEALSTRRTILGTTVQDSRIHNALLPDAYKEARIARVNGNDTIMSKRFRDLGSKGVTADQIWHAYVQNGLKTGWITTDTGKYAGRFGGAGVGTRINTKVQHLTENIEDYARLAHFIDRIQRSRLPTFELAAEEAASYVRKFHFDYNDFTHTEKAVLSRIFPFYKWTRKNIPLQLSLLFQKPGYLTTQMHGLTAISNAMGFSNHGQNVPTAEEVMPQWLRDHLAVPVGMGHSGVRYLDAPLPTPQAFQFFGSSPLETEQSVAYMANPLLKIPFELATGHQIGGAPIQSDKYAAGQTPYSNLLFNLLNPSNTGKSTNLAQFLLGLGLVENTPARIKGELKREQSALSATRKKYRKQHHMTPLGYTLP